MQFYSTNNKSHTVSLKEAVLKGLADDNGLYMPEHIPVLPKEFFSAISSSSFPEIALAVASALLEDSIPAAALKDIIEKAINFDAPLVKINDEISALELFHGPTLAFKDYGARFMAGLTSHFISNEGTELTILVATSGDTGSAVASGFFNVPGIRIYILYPSGKVSETQEKQLTTWGGNITALEVAGNFDDCQRMVKQAFLDEDIKKKRMLSSANSINIARLIPQSFYYFRAYAQLKSKIRPLVFSVPSGNFGNLTAGLLAAKMGLPVSKFIAATNINNVVPHYLATGDFSPRPSHPTISNAMDVGNPSNFARMLDLIPDRKEMNSLIRGYSFTDDKTKGAIKVLNQNYKYIADPHGAIGFLGLNEYKKEHPERINGIFLETAHPAKFIDTVEATIRKKIDVPAALQEFISKKKVSIPVSNAFEELKELLLKP